MGEAHRGGGAAPDARRRPFAGRLRRASRACRRLVAATASAGRLARMLAFARFFGPFLGQVSGSSDRSPSNARKPRRGLLPDRRGVGSNAVPQAASSNGRRPDRGKRAAQPIKTFEAAIGRDLPAAQRAAVDRAATLVEGGAAFGRRLAPVSIFLK